MTGFRIGSHEIGAGRPCFVVAEIGQAHDGSLGTAHAYIDAAAAAGADAVKFQTHIAAEESTPAEPFRTRFWPQDQTRYDYWRRMEFSDDQWAALAGHAAERGLVFLSSPFSLAAVALLQRIGVPAWKIGAGEANNLPLLDAVAAAGKPVLLSTGMSTWSEIDAAVRRLRRSGVALAVLQCTSAYPCPPGEVGLNLLAEFRERFDCPVGLSDHSGTIFAGLAAAALGADVLEVHVTFSRECFGPDVPASVTTAELAQLVAGVRFIEAALAHPVDKDTLAEEMADVRAVFSKSIVAAQSLAAGHCLTREDLAFKKPGIGIPAAEWEGLIGRIVKHNLAADHFFDEDDFQ